VLTLVSFLGKARWDRHQRRELEAPVEAPGGFGQIAPGVLLLLDRVVQGLCHFVWNLSLT
jgi:hypothetical protein